MCCSGRRTLGCLVQWVVKSKLEIDGVSWYSSSTDDSKAFHIHRLMRSFIGCKCTAARSNAHRPCGIPLSPQSRNPAERCQLSGLSTHWITINACVLAPPAASRKELNCHLTAAPPADRNYKHTQSGTAILNPNFNKNSFNGFKCKILLY